jgi:cell division inhibitor SepF
MPGTGKKVLMWLGLADADEYDDYEAYEDAAAPAAAGPPPAPAPAPARRPAEVLEPVPASQASPAVRTLPRDGQDGGAPINLRAAAPAPLRTVPAAVAAPVNPFQALAAKVHVAAPSEFADAQEIADRFRSGQPVIVNLGNAYRELAHRMIDFCSGVAYALGGSMDKVADKVFLMTPSNVELSAEEKRRLQERGLYRS